MTAELIKTYTFNEEKNWLIFDNKYWITPRNLVNIKKFEKGIQVYSSPWKAFGRIYFKNDRLHIFDYKTNKEVAYCPVDDKFLKDIEDQLPPITQWIF